MSDTSRLLLAPLACAFILAGCDSARGAPGRGAFDGERALGYAREHMAFGPRVPGTESARRAGDWIVRQMQTRSDTVVVQEWTHHTTDGKQLPMRNILARIRPDLPDRVLYVVHWDTRPVSDNESDGALRSTPVPGANDGASGVALMIALADELRTNPPAVGVDLLFVDGEDWGDFGAMTDVLIGSTYFARNPPNPGYRPIFGVVWDMIGDRDLRIRREGNSVAAAPEVVERVWSAARDLGYDDVFVDERMDGITDDHIPLLRAGMRVIDVIDLDYPHHHRTTDTIERISAQSLSIVGDVALALVR